MHRNRYLNESISIQNCSFLNPMCSSLLTDEYLLQKTIRFIPMMKFRQSTKLILKLYSLNSWQHLVIFAIFGKSWATQRAINRRNERLYLFIIWKFIQQACIQFLHLQLWRKLMYFSNPNRDKSFTSSESKRSTLLTLMPRKLEIVFLRV